MTVRYETMKGVYPGTTSPHDRDIHVSPNGIFFVCPCAKDIHVLPYTEAVGQYHA